MPEKSIYLKPRMSEKASFIMICLSVILMLVCTLLKGAAYTFSQQSGIELRIIMYHSILKDPSRTGVYVITPSQLRSDLEYLSAKGYKTVLPRDLVGYVRGETRLPEKCVMLTFDDGCYNNLTYLLPLLKEFSYTALISVVGKYTQLYTDSGDKNPNYTYLAYDDLLLLEQSGLIEIGNHTYNLHNNGVLPGSGKANGENESAYQARLENDLMLLQRELEKNGLTKPLCYTYPFGIISNASLDAVKRCGFKVSLSCREKTNIITKDPECLFLLNRYNRSGLTDTASFMKKLGI